MHSLFRLLAPTRTAPKPATVQRDTIGFVLADGRRIDVLRVRDARARRVKLSVDERGARLTLPTRASLIAGERFLHEHRDWLRLQLAAQGEHAGEGLLRGITTALPLRGQDLPLHWTGGRAMRIDLDADASLLFAAPATAGDAGLRRTLRDFYEAQGRADVGVRIRAGARTLPPAPRRSLAALLARGGSTLPGLAGRTPLFPRRRSAIEGAPAWPAGRLTCPAALPRADNEGKPP